VLLYIVVPVIAAQLVRRAVLASGGQRSTGCWSPRPGIARSLLATLVLLFGFQGEAIVAQPLVIALLAVPILIQVYFNAGPGCRAASAWHGAWRRLRR
jgi:ACR3 family arsenite transporter